MARVFTDEGVRLMVLSVIPAAPAALTTTLLNAGTNISDFAVAGDSTFAQAASDTITEKSYKDKGKVEIPTTKNQNVSAVLYRDRDGTGALTVADPIKGKLDDRQKVCFIKRKGVPEDVAFAVGQDYEYFIVRADEVITLNDNDGGFEKAQVNFRAGGDSGFGIVAA